MKTIPGPYRDPAPRPVLKLAVALERRARDEHVRRERNARVAGAVVVVCALAGIVALAVSM